MTAVEAINKIRIMLGLDDAEANAGASVEKTISNVELASATLLDGTIVKTEGDFEVGKQLLVETAEGDIPAPQATHETTDGLLVSVDENGVITEIEEKAAEEEVETKEQEFNADFVNALVNALKPSLDKIDTLAEDVSRLKGQFREYIDEPATPKIYNNLNDLVRKEQSLMDSRMAKLIELRKQK